MVGLSGTGRGNKPHCYYACQKKRREHSCEKKNVQREWIEDVVVKAAVEYVLQPEVLEWVADCCVAYQKREEAGSQLELLKAQRSEVKRSLDNVMKAIEAGIITVTTKGRLEELESELVRLDDSIAAEGAALVRMSRDEILYTLEKFCNGDIEDQEYRRKIVDTFVAAVYLWDDKIRIGFNWSGTKSEVDMALVTEAETCVAVDGGSYKAGCALPQSGKANHAVTIYFVGPLFVLSMPLPKR
jgi:hypothetical protein